MADQCEFRFVYIPADVSRPLEQWSQVIEKGREVECLLDRLKSHFLTSHPSITEKQRQQHKEELLRQKGLDKMKGAVSEHLLDAATSMQLVESIALVPCMPRHRSIGVTMYVDDSGAFKQLPVNVRATDIAQSCGMIDTHVLGDAFVGRVKENDVEFERLDFLLPELSSNAQWMNAARRHNKEKLKQPAAEELMKQLSDKNRPRITEITPAEDARQEGNKAYRKGDYNAAVESYSLCLKHDPESALAYSNRAMAYLQLENFEEALADSEAALKLDSESIKARYRRGVALESLGRRDEAIREFQAILEQQPSNKAASEQLHRLQQTLHNSDKQYPMQQSCH